MAGADRVRVVPDDFDLAAEVAALTAAGEAGDEVGAVVSFVGIVRGGDVLAMELEHYPGMTERAIEAMVDAAHERFDIHAGRVVHRVGRLAPGDRIVLVAVAARHRGEAFRACEFLIDYLKTQAPFWKKEHTARGARWVDARSTDDAALARWGIDGANS